MASHSVVLAVTLSAACLALGYHLGSRSVPPTTFIPSGIREPEIPNEDREEDEADGDLSSIKAGLLEPCKLVRGTLSLQLFISNVHRLLSYAQI